MPLFSIHQLKLLEYSKRSIVTKFDVSSPGAIINEAYFMEILRLCLQYLMLSGKVLLKV